MAFDVDLAADLLIWARRDPSRKLKRWRSADFGWKEEDLDYCRGIAVFANPREAPFGWASAGRDGGPT